MQIAAYGCKAISRLFGVAAFLALAAGAGCDSRSKTMPDPMSDGGERNDAGDRDAGDGHDAGFAGCADAGAPAELALVPEFVTLFHHVASECNTLANGILVKNVGASAISVEEIAVVPSNFGVTAERLPQEIEPGAYLTLHLRFVTDEESELDGTLVVRTSNGCSELPIRGLATADLLAGSSESAIDFGAHPAGTTSEPREYVILTQRGPASEYWTRYSGFAAEPADVFELVTEPTEEEVEPQACEPIELRVRFHAPSTPGPVEGGLYYLATTDTAEGSFEGIALVPLFGFATQP